MTSLMASFKPCAHSAGRQQRSTATAPSARMGGGGGGGGGVSNNNRLIIPGQEGNNRPGGRLVVPGQGGGTAPRNLGGGSGLVGGGDDTTQATQRAFRPPPGFMNETNDMDAPELNIPTDEMLNRLRSLTGHWHQLAKFLPALQRAGFDSISLEEATGLERKTQNVWNTAAQVYESIATPGLLSPQALARFDTDGEDLLYELRFLSVKQRAPVAAYIATNGLGPRECQALARAVKEYERREGVKEGFTDSPGDVLAYKHYRDAQECRRRDDVQAAARRGLTTAESDAAREKLTAMLEEQEGRYNALPTATLTMLRMARDELGFRPLAVAGELQTVTEEQLMSTPKVSSEGVFGNFKVPNDGVQHEWVALPNWSLLTLAGHPIALKIENCALVPQVKLSSQAKTEDEIKKMSGLGVLVVDIAAEDQELDAGKYYMATDGGGKVQLMAGTEAAAAARVLGPVLFLCRPPSRDTAAASTSELMSV